MPADLSDRSTALVKATVAAVEQHGLAITRRMHERMFQNEAIRGLFNQSHHGGTGSHHAMGPRLRELAVFLAVYAPMLLRPRPDGKPG